MAAEKTPRRLGRGLEALLAQKPLASAKKDEPYERAETDSPFREIPISSIRANQYQPRKTFKAEELEELRNSIRVTGLLQPITVRQLSEDNSFELVAGERRLRAAQLLGWSNIPAIVREYDDQTMLTLALVENLQRSDLNPIEEAEGYARLAEEFSLTQVEIAKLVGKDRSTIANLLRILQLPSSIRKMVEAGELTAGHARPLLTLEDESIMSRVAREVVEQSLSVRAVEEKVRAATRKEDKLPAKQPKRNSPDSPYASLTPESTNDSGEIKYVEDLLRKKLQTDVAIQIRQGQKGELKIQFYSYDDLNRLLDIMDVLE